MQIAPFLGGAIADPNESARHFLEEPGEILTRHGWAHIAARFSHGGGSSRSKITLRRRIRRHAKARADDQRALHAAGCRHAIRNALQAFPDGVARFVIQPAHGALDGHAARDLILRLAALDHGQADHAAHQRVHAARDDGLRRDNRMARGQHRVACQMRQGCMAGMAIENQFNARTGGHHRAVMNGNGAGRQARPIMPAKNPVHREAREKPIGNHGPRTTAAFFRRLKHQMHRTGPALIVQQHPRRAQ